MRDARLWAGVTAAVLAVAGCGAPSSTPPAPPTETPSAPPLSTPADGSPGPTSSATPSTGAWDEFVAGIDPAVRTSDVAGGWAITFTLVGFESDGVDYEPYLPIGGEEEWTWAVTPTCPNAACDVDFVATSPLLSGSFPSSLDWLPDEQHYFSQGITPLPQAYCRDDAGARIPDSYQVEQTISLVPTKAETEEARPRASELIGVRIDIGMPVAGMPDDCGTFQESWDILGSRAD